MIRESLILVLLGCALGLANPIQPNVAPQQGNAGDIASWVRSSHNQIEQLITETVQPYLATYQSLIKAGKNVQRYSIDGIEELRAIFNEIIDKSRENIGDLENIVLTNLISSLQNAVELLSMKPSFPGIEQAINQNVQAGQQAVNSGNQKLQEIAGDQMNNVQNQFDQWKNGAWSAVNNGNQNLQEIASDQMNNAQNQFGQWKNAAWSTVNNGNQKLQGIAGDQVNNAQNQFDQWQDAAWSATNGAGQFFNNMGQKGQGIVNGQKQNFEAGFNGAFKQGQGFFDRLGNKMQNAVGQTVNHRASPIQNQFDQVGSSGVTIADKFGGEAQGILNTGANYFKDNAQNAVNGLFNVGNRVPKVIDNRVDDIGQGWGQFLSPGNIAQGFNKLGSQVQDVYKNGVAGFGNQFNQAKESFNKLGNQAQNAVGSGISGVQSQFNQLGEVTNKLGSQAQDFMNNGINGAKNQLGQLVPSIGGGINQFGSQFKGASDEGINGMKNQFNQHASSIGEGVNQFSNQVQGAFQNGLKGVNPFNQFGETINKYGNQAQHAFDNGVNGAKNQLNQLVPSTNNQGNNGNIFSGEQLLANVAKPWAGAVATQVKELKSALDQWKNTVDKFLAAGQNNVEQQQITGTNKGVPNMPGSSGFMPSINGEVNILGKPNANEGMPNMEGSTGYMPNINEEILAPSKPNGKDGIFSTIGQQIGGFFGKPMDKIADGFGNAVKGFQQMLPFKF